MGRLARHAICLAVLFAAAAGLPIGVSIALAQDTSAADPLAEQGYSETTGAAAGYVEDAACGQCHADKAESFAQVAMSRSFYRPSPGNVIEDFSLLPYFHAPSKRRYRIWLEGGEYWFERFRIADDGQAVDRFAVRIDWIIGSGNHVRTYFYQTADGALFELPLSWYSQERKWAMSPGFEWPDHPGVLRQVRRECMACHNAFPQVEAGSDRAGIDDVFPHQLPQGIGCQRCHGPGADHVRAAFTGNDSVEQLRARIVNPARLPAAERYGMCYGCHMQPSVAMPGIRRFGRDAYSFRPGEKLTDFRIDLDIDAVGVPGHDRFEINHHPYRLEQSACFIESKGELGCLTCHDPHVKIAKEERAAHYRAACLTCHALDEAGLPAATTGSKAASTTHPAIGDSDDCTTCHMPQRRTQDVIEVTMTDHRIVRDPGPANLVAPFEKKDTEVSAVRLLKPVEGLDPADATAYKATAVLRFTNGSDEDAAAALQKWLYSRDPQQFEPWFELGKSLVARKHFEAAGPVLAQAQKLSPHHPGIAEMQAGAQFRTGDHANAIATLRAILDADPNSTETRLKLAYMLEEDGQDTEALEQARTALSARHNLWQAWRLIGVIEAKAGRHDEAAQAFFQALALAPGEKTSQAGLIAALDKLGRAAEAALYRQ